MKHQKKSRKNSLVSTLFLTIISVLLFLLFGINQAFAATAPPVEWHKNYDDYRLSSVRQTADGGFITIGGYWESNTYLLKTDANGNKQWDKIWNYGEGRDILVTESGYVIISSLSYYEDEGETHIIETHIIKTDLNGNIIWENVVGGLNGEKIEKTANGFVIMGTGGLAFTDQLGNLLWTSRPGVDAGTYSFKGTSDGGYVLVGVKNNDRYIVKTNNVGVKQWDKIIARPSSGDAATDVLQTGDGGYFVAGYVSFGSNFLKLDSSGNTVWDHTFNGVNNSLDSALSAIETNDGYVIAGCSSTKNIVIKTNFLGEQIWNKVIDTPESFIYATSIQQTDDGGFILAGYEGGSSVLIKLAPEDFTPPIVSATPIGGMYNSTKSVILTANEPADIYYTTNGSDPTVNSVRYTGPINITANTTLKFMAVDNAGNQSSTTYMEEYVIDLASPVTSADLQGTQGTNGWFKSDVQVTLNAVDNEGGSGVDYTEYSLDGTNWTTYSGPLTIMTEGETTVHYRSIDEVGNIETERTVEVKIEKTLPTITILNPVESNQFLINQVVLANWLTDSVSGFVNINATALGGQPINTTSAGSKIFSVFAETYAGNQVSATVNYSVKYSYVGILQPINSDESSIFTIGTNSIIPVKFQLSDDLGSYVTNAAAQISLEKIGDSISGTDNETIFNGQGTAGNQFLYNSNSNMYIYNIDTTTLSSGTWKITISLDDGTSKEAVISLR